MLRACADGCRVNHFLRGSHSYAIPDVVRRCDEAILSTFEDIIGCGLSGHQRMQACLPLSSGGRGIKGVS